ncbi:MAG: hypothetical protein AB1726_05650 [Planctomycetota bacterium]
MRSRRRFLRIVLVLFLILLVAGYGAVSTLLVNPFEGRYEYDVSTLVPRDVDFYLAKANLAGDFDPFPRLAFYDDLEKARGGTALLQTAAVKDLRAAVDLQPTLAGIEEFLAQLPLETSPLSLFGGSDLALAGHFQGGDLAKAQWAAYGRTNWIGRVGVELLRYPDTIGLSDQGLVVQAVKRGEETVGHSLAGGELAQTVYVTRIRDVVVVSNTADLVQKAVEFEAKRGEDSLGLSGKYNPIDVARSTGDELELYVDQKALATSMGWSGQWPDPSAESLPAAVGGKLFQVGLLNEVVGSCRIGRDLSLRLHAQLSSEEMTKEQKRLFREAGFDLRTAQSAARLAPDDVGMFLYAHADVGDLLRALASSLPEARLGLIEDTIREVWGHTECFPLIDDIDAAVRDQFAILVRPHDYPDEGENGPPHDDTPVLAWALVLWPKEAARVAELESTIQRHQGAFRIQGREPGSRGVMENTLAGGSKIFEYWQPFVAGTGMVATLSMTGEDSYFVLSNSHNLLNDLNATYWGRPGARPRLSEQSTFQSFVLGGLKSANAVLWLNPRAVAASLKAIAEFQAGLDVRSEIDWTTEGPGIRRRLLREHWPEEDPGNVTPEVESQLDLLYDQETERIKNEWVREHGNEKAEAYVRRVEVLEVLGAAMLQLAVDRTRMDAQLSLWLPFD